MTKLRSTLPALPMPFSPWFKVTKLCKSLDDWNQKLDIVESTSLTVSWELSQHSRIILDTKKHTSSTQSAPPRSNDIQDQSPDLAGNKTPTWFWIYPDTTNVTTDTTIISDNSFEQQFYNFRQQWTRTTNNNHHSNKKKKKNSNNRRRRRRKNSISKSSNQKSRPTSNFSSVDSQFLRLVPAVPRGCHHPRQLEGRCPGEISVTILNHKFCYE